MTSTQSSPSLERTLKKQKSEKCDISHKIIIFLCKNITVLRYHGIIITAIKCVVLHFLYHAHAQAICSLSIWADRHALIWADV